MATLTTAERFQQASRHVLSAMELLFILDDESPQREMLHTMRELRGALMSAQEEVSIRGPVPPIRKLPCGCCTNGCVCSHHNPTLGGALIPCNLHAEKVDPPPVEHVASAEPDDLAGRVSDILRQKDGEV